MEKITLIFFKIYMSYNEPNIIYNDKKNQKKIRDIL